MPDRLSTGIEWAVAGIPVTRYFSFFSEIREAAESKVYNRVFDYQVSKGLGPREVSALYEKNIKHLESIGFSPRFGAYREHLLAYAASKDIHTRS